MSYCPFDQLMHPAKYKYCLKTKNLTDPNYKDVSSLTWHRWHSIRWHVLQSPPWLMLPAALFMYESDMWSKWAWTIIFHSLFKHPVSIPAAAGVASAHSHRSVRDPTSKCAAQPHHRLTMRRGQQRASQSPYWRTRWPGGVPPLSRLTRRACERYFLVIMQCEVISPPGQGYENVPLLFCVLSAFINPHTNEHTHSLVVCVKRWASLLLLLMLMVRVFWKKKSLKSLTVIIKT